MKQIFFFVCACFLATGTTAQDYVINASTGTSLPYEYNASGSTVLGIPSVDVLSAWQTIPFSFDFYGQSVTGYKVSDNGYITFDNGASTSDPSNTAIPSVGGPNNAIYAFWDDLEVISGSGSADDVFNYTYGTAPNRVHVIQWYSVTPISGTGFVYTAIRLYECGDFDIIHNYGNATGMTATVGCENASGTIGVQTAGSPIEDYPSVGSLGDDDVVYTFYWDQINYDLSVTSIDLSGFVYIGSNTISGTIANNGGSNITSFDLNYTVDGGPVQTMPVTSTLNAAGGTYSFSHNIPWDVTVGGQYHDLCVWGDNINGSNADERTCNDELCVNLFSGTGNSGTRSVLIEEFTGAWCGWCPDGGVILDDILTTYPNDVVGVSIHDGDAMEIADSIRSGFAVSAYPNGMVDRKVFAGEPDEPHSRGSWTSNTVSQIGSYTPADVYLTHLYEPATRQITMEVKGVFADYSTGDMRFVAMVVEDGVTGTGSGYDQVNYLNTTAGHPFEGAGDPIIGFVHNHVLRALPGGGFGIAGTIPTTVSPGDEFTETFTYTLPASMDETKIKLIGFMAYNSATVGEREVIDVDQADLGYQGNAGLGMTKLATSIEVYPNPSSDLVNLNFELQESNDTRIVIYDAYGKQVALVNQNLLNSGSQHFTYDVSKFEKGVYFISITVDKNTTYTERFVVVD